MKNSIPKYQLKELTKNFAPAAADPSWKTREEHSQSMQNKLNSERIRELKLKFWGRITLSLFFVLLLAWQNYQVFSAVTSAFQNNQLQQLGLIFTTLVGATLTETYFIAKVIVNFMFKDNDYSYGAH